MHAHNKEDVMIGKRILLAAGFCTCLLCFAGIAMAESLKDIQFIMISFDDAKATIKKGDGSLQIIQPGDVIADTYTVKRIKNGKISLENSAADGPKIVFVRVERGQQVIEALGSNRSAGAPGTPAQ
jgi:hypothetical protein